MTGETQKTRTPWTAPPSLQECVRAFEASLVTGPQVERVFVLGAGFSGHFQFSTSKGVVPGIVEFFQSNPLSSWYSDHYQRMIRWLERHHRGWRQEHPSLTKFVTTFFESQTVRRDSIAIDPIELGRYGVSWEQDNFEPLEIAAYLPTSPIYEDYLIPFEVLLATYLWAGRTSNEVETPDAKHFFESLRPTDVIVTLNWDVIPEVLLTETGQAFSRYEWTPELLPVIKLHGSVDLFGLPNGAMQRDADENPHVLEKITTHTWRCVTSSESIYRAPPFRALFPWERYRKSPILIMPPFYTFGYGYELIQFNWRRAEVALERAKEVHFVGYSIPEADLAFRRMLSRASRRWSPNVGLHVWDPALEVGDRAEFLCRRPFRRHVGGTGELFTTMAHAA